MSKLYDWWRGYQEENIRLRNEPRAMREEVFDIIGMAILAILIWAAIVIIMV